MLGHLRKSPLRQVIGHRLTNYLLSENTASKNRHHDTSHTSASRPSTSSRNHAITTQNNASDTFIKNKFNNSAIRYDSGSANANNSADSHHPSKRRRRDYDHMDGIQSSSVTNDIRKHGDSSRIDSNSHPIQRLDEKTPSTTNRDVNRRPSTSALESNSRTKRSPEKLLSLNQINTIGDFLKDTVTTKNIPPHSSSHTQKKYSETFDLPKLNSIMTEKAPPPKMERQSSSFQEEKYLKNYRFLT